MKPQRAARGSQRFVERTQFTLFTARARAKARQSLSVRQRQLASVRHRPSHTYMVCYWLCNIFNMGCCYTALAHAHVATGRALPRASVGGRVCVCVFVCQRCWHELLHGSPTPTPSPTQTAAAHLNDAWPLAQPIASTRSIGWVGRFLFLIFFVFIFFLFFIKWWSCAYFNMAALNFAACVYYDCSRWHCLAPGQHRQQQHQLQLLEWMWMWMEWNGISVGPTLRGHEMCAPYCTSSFIYKSFFLLL